MVANLTLSDCGWSKNGIQKGSRNDILYEYYGWLVTC